MRFSRKKSVTITDNITIPSQVLTAKEYDQSIGNPAANNNASKSHFHDAAIAKSAHTAKLRMLSKRAKRKSKKSILKNGSSSSLSSTTKQKEGVKNSNKPKVSSNGTSKDSTTTTTSNNTAATASSTMSITVNGKPILNIEPNATPEDVQTFLNTLQVGLQSKSYEQQKKNKKIINDDDDEDDIQDILPTSTSETEASSEEELDDILPTTTSETEASAESRDSDIKLGPRATQKFEQMEKDMDAEVSLYDDKLGKSLRTLLEMKSKMSGKL